MFYVFFFDDTDNTLVGRVLDTKARVREECDGISAAGLKPHVVELYAFDVEWDGRTLTADGRETVRAYLEYAKYHNLLV